jgi:hypothetical protein
MIFCVLEQIPWLKLFWFILEHFFTQTKINALEAFPYIWKTPKQASVDYFKLLNIET